MRRTFRYCLKRGQIKMSIVAKNIYNMAKFKPLDFKSLTISEAEWKSKTLGKLYILGDVKTSQFVDTFRKCHGNIFRTFELLETRLDNFLFRTHLADSVFQARTFISGKNIEVNGKLVSSPSHKLAVGDMVTVKLRIWDQIKTQSNNPFRKFWGFLPGYVDVNFASLSAVLHKHPTFEEIPVPYSRSIVQAMGAFFTRRI